MGLATSRPATPTPVSSDPSTAIHPTAPEWSLGAASLRQLHHQLDRLDEITEQLQIPYFSFSDEILAGKCLKVYDGDTCHFVVWIANRWVRIRFRLMGYDSPEMNSPDPEKRQAAIAARDYLASRLLGQKVILYLHKFDKYGRPLCDVYVYHPEKNLTVANMIADHINPDMIAKGYGVPYFGGHRSIDPQQEGDEELVSNYGVTARLADSSPSSTPSATSSSVSVPTIASPPPTIVVSPLTKCQRIKQSVRRWFSRCHT